MAKKLDSVQGWCTMHDTFILEGGVGGIQLQPSFQPSFHLGGMNSLIQSTVSESK